MLDKLQCNIGLHTWGAVKQVVENGEVFIAVRCERCGKLMRLPNDRRN